MIPTKQGTKLFCNLSGSARDAVDELPVETIISERGVEAILEKLKEHYQPYLETAMPKGFERAIYGEARKGKEQLSENIIRVEAAFARLQEEGVKLPTEVKGYVMFRQAALASVQEDQVTTWTSGKYDRETVVAALRKIGEGAEGEGRS